MEGVLFAGALLVLGSPDALVQRVEPQAIVGGRPTEGNEFDAVVAVSTGTGTCTGTLVAPGLILTAAHCFFPLPPLDAIRVTQGKRVSSGEATVGAVAYGTHPQFCPTCDEDAYDFAYVAVEPGLTAVPIPPVTNADEWEEAVAVDAQVTLVGYGADQPLSGGVGQKRRVETSIGRFTELGFEFYAGGNGRDSCEGDSGGPALSKLRSGEWRLVGVVSRGSAPCGQGGYYGVPYAALPWLANTTGVNLCGPDCGTCDCIDTRPPRDEDGCSVSEKRPSKWALLVVVALLGMRRRRGCAQRRYSSKQNTAR